MHNLIINPEWAFSFSIWIIFPNSQSILSIIRSDYNSIGSFHLRYGTTISIPCLLGLIYSLVHVHVIVMLVIHMNAILLTI